MAYRPPSALHAVPRRGQSRVLVWDVAIRLFHWLLVAGVVTAWTTGGSGYRIHEIVGGGITALVAFRIIWGLVGSRRARFCDFVESPGAVLGDINDVVHKRAARHVGHNPAGGYMILALLATITVICVTGIMQLTNTFFGVEWVEEVHHWAANALLVLVPLHVMGALLSSVMHQENLIAAMITGRKPLAVAGEIIIVDPRLRRRRLLDHMDTRTRGRRGLAVLVMLLSGGLSSGWYVTQKRSAGEPAFAEGQPATVPSAISAPTVVAGTGVHQEAKSNEGAGAEAALSLPTRVSGGPPALARHEVSSQTADTVPAPSDDSGAERHRQEFAAAEQDRAQLRERQVQLVQERLHVAQREVQEARAQEERLQQRETRLRQEREDVIAAREREQRIRVADR